MTSELLHYVTQLAVYFTLRGVTMTPDMTKHLTVDHVRHVTL